LNIAKRRGKALPCISNHQYFEMGFKVDEVQVYGLGAFWVRSKFEFGSCIARRRNWLEVKGNVEDACEDLERQD
jgi:hypothetical protein